MQLLPLLGALLILGQTSGFRPLRQQQQQQPLTRVGKVGMSLDTASTLVPALLREVSKTEATGAFYFFFLAGSGALGIGFAQVPKLLAEYRAIANLKGQGETLGGEALPLGPIAGFGYPSELATADVVRIISKLPSVDEISAKGKKKTYMAQRGYLERQAFVDCYPPSENQLALYVVFDALSGGGSSSVASPIFVKDAAERWQEELPSLDAFVGDLSRAQIGKISGFSGLAFLIVLVLDLIVESGITAFS